MCHLVRPPRKQHALQASKTSDLELKDTIRQAKNAIEAKKLARVVKVSIRLAKPAIFSAYICSCEGSCRTAWGPLHGQTAVTRAVFAA